MSSKRNSALYRIYIAVLGVAAAVAVVGGVFTAWAATSSAATDGRSAERRRAERHGDDPCRSGPPHDAGDVDGHGADHVRVPLVPVRRSGGA